MKLPAGLIDEINSKKPRHHKKVILDTKQFDSPYYLSNAFMNAAEASKWTKEEIDEVMQEARSGDLDHFFLTINSYSKPPVVLNLSVATIKP